MDQLVKSMVKVIGVLQMARYKTYASLSDDTVIDMAKLYAAVIAKDSRLTVEIMQKTAMRYVEGEVTIWSKGAFVPAPREFPSPAEFRDACVQTWGEIYEMRAIGETVNEDGTRVIQTKQFKKNDPQPGVLALEAPASPETVAQIKARIDKLVPALTLSEAVVSRERASNPNAAEELERMAQIRRQHEGGKA